MSRYDKPYKTYSEMLELLRGRNLTIETHLEKFAFQALSFSSYYTLVNGNKHIFCDPQNNDWFTDGTTFEHLYISHLIQSDIHSLILKYIIHVEHSFKTKLSEVVARDYGIAALEIQDNSVQNYLSLRKYSNSNNSRYNTLRAIKDQIEELRANRPKSISHYYLHNKNHLPPWILIRDMSFGLAFRWYKILRGPHRLELCKKMLSSKTLIDHQQYFNSCPLCDDHLRELFSKIMSLLVESRNSIAHGERLLPYRMKTKLPKTPLLQIFDEKTLTEKEYNKGIGQNDHFAVLYSILLLMDDPLLSNLFVIEYDGKIGQYQKVENKSIFDIGAVPMHKLFGTPENTVERLYHLMNSKFTK